MKYHMYYSFIAIPIVLMLIFGIEDKNADFFKYGNGVAAEYKIIYQEQIFHLGEMVSLWALIVTLSIVFIMISWMIHEGVKAYQYNRSLRNL